MAWQVHDRPPHTGARRLHTGMERLVEKVSFEAPEKNGDLVTIDVDYVNEHLADLVDNEDLSQYIL